MSKVVMLSLDDESAAIWKALPHSRKSEMVRECMKNAMIVKEKQATIDGLMKRCRELQQEKNALSLEIVNLEAFGVKE